MGMAASQARFLGLTARKSNTEYEGQQVNQQRTALANKSAGLFNQMLSLEVPTPPSATNYYSIRYTYSDDGTDFEIISQTPQSDGKYRVKVKETYAAEVATKYQLYGTFQRHVDDDGNITYSYNGNELKSVVDDDLAKEIGITDSTFWKYQNETADSFYIKNSDFQKILEKLIDVDEYSCTTDQYERVAGQKTKYEELTDVAFESDTTGRLTRIKYTRSDGQYVSKDLTMTEVQDTTGYDTAMNEYYYKKAVYDKTIEDINSKTKIIQQQDRTLELRLRQLDTEQNALKTEMEAVKKVIEDNVNSTFKTFQA